MCAVYEYIYLCPPLVPVVSSCSSVVLIAAVSWGTPRVNLSTSSGYVIHSVRDEGIQSLGYVYQRLCPIQPTQSLSVCVDTHSAAALADERVDATDIRYHRPLHYSI
jgi:hypothetical protein